MLQANFAYAIHNDRRNSDWKITLGLWAIMLAALLHKEILIPWYVWFTLPVVYAIFWASPMCLANRNNKEWYNYYMKQAAQTLAQGDHVVTSPPEPIPLIRGRLLFLGDWSSIFQVTVTSCLAVIAVFFRHA